MILKCKMLMNCEHFDFLLPFSKFLLDRHSEKRKKLEKEPPSVSRGLLLRDFHPWASLSRILNWCPQTHKRKCELDTNHFSLQPEGISNLGFNIFAIWISWPKQRSRKSIIMGINIIIAIKININSITSPDNLSNENDNIDIQFFGEKNSKIALLEHRYSFFWRKKLKNSKTNNILYHPPSLFPPPVPATGV